MLYYPGLFVTRNPFLGAFGLPLLCYPFGKFGKKEIEGFFRTKKSPFLPF